MVMRNKKFLAMICLMTMGASLTGCGSKGQESNCTSDVKNETGVAYDYASPQSASDYGASGAVAGNKMEAEGDYYATDVMYETSTVQEGYYEEFNTEEYNPIEENGFIKVSSAPESTFAADVDTGSYTNFRRMVKDNYSIENIPAGSIRVEEMINYFDYVVEETNDGKAFAVRYETGICPWNEDNKLLMMTVKAKDADIKSQGNNFIFLIDSSGSMSYDESKGELAVKSFKLLAETLNKNDRVSIVTYSGSSRVVLDSCTGNKYEEICDALDSIEFGGGTNGSGGISAAYELAEKNFIEGGNNRVIIASDGDMNLGITSQGGLVDLIKEKKETGVFLTVLGYGSGNYSDANMESIADAGNGNYYYIDCIDEADRVLVDKLKQTTITVAKDVKLQVEFNPLEVSEYRLIGYENRTMAADDFEDDAKDGGETGAGQTVTVLYELVCNDVASEGSDLKYQTDRELTEDALTGELLTLSVRYKEPDGDVSVEESFAVTDNADVTQQQSADFCFAAGVAELAMILNDSAYKGTADLESAYDLVMMGAGENDYRKELGKMIKTLGY